MHFRYNYEKNSQLLDTRRISSEEIIQAISERNILDIRKHPNELKYSNQNIFYVRLLEEGSCCKWQVKKLSCKKQ